MIQPFHQTAAPRRHVLLCATGLSPQVVTETLHALASGAAGGVIVPEAVHVVSTSEGADRVRQWLLSVEPGWFHRLRVDLHLPPIHFDESTIHVLRDAQGAELADLRSAADNAAAADGIAELVRQLTRDPSTCLHVSLAGGRKTLGFFAGYALSLFGRSQDRLSHVLVEAPFESSADFFYPTPYSRVIGVGPAGSLPVDCRDARVTLADIPFVRLREGLPKALLEGRSGFAEAVAAAQPGFATPYLRIEVDRARLEAGGRTVRMPPAQLAFYLWFARRAKAGQPGLVRPTDGFPDAAYAADYRAAYDALRGITPALERRFSQGMALGDFDISKSKVNATLRAALGSVAPHYEILGDGERVQRFALRLPPACILIEGER